MFLLGWIGDEGYIVTIMYSKQYTLQEMIAYLPAYINLYVVFSYTVYIFQHYIIRESVDSLCRDGADASIT